MKVEPKIAIARILVDFNLAVRYGIAIRTRTRTRIYRSVLGKHPLLDAEVPHYKGSMEQLLYKRMEVISWVSAHAGQNCD